MAVADSAAECATVRGFLRERRAGSLAREQGVTMASWRRWGGRALPLLLAQSLCGCAIIDNYSGRAVDYNLQAEQAQQEVLLLNIVRASLRRPMQFTSVQSLTGSASISGGVSGGVAGTKQVPWVSRFLNMSPAGQAVGTNSALSSISVGNVSGTANLGGTATFTVPVLDTQEFYQGILTPLGLQGVDYYIQQGFPPEMLFDLFVLKVEVTRRDDGSCRKFTFINSVSNDLQFAQFQAFAEYLLGSGLYTERVSQITAYGPPIPMSRAAPATVDQAANLVEAYSKASSAGLEIKGDQSGGHSSFRIQKKTSNFRFCFAYPGGEPSNWLAQPNSTIFCGHFNRRGAARTVTPDPETQNECVPRLGRTAGTQVAEDYDAGSRGVHEGGVSEFNGIRLAPEFLKRIDRIQREALAKNPNLPDEALFRPAAFDGGLVSFKFFSRSTEGILYYLGEITRRRLYPEYGAPRTIQIKTSLRYGTFPQTDCDDRENGAANQEKFDLIHLSRGRHGAPAPGSYYCENLFVLDNDSGTDNVISVSYDGATFGVPRDPKRSGRTLQVIELTKQLIALNTSAKTFPSTGVITLIGP
jgi:hypothetical protein